MEATGGYLRDVNLSDSLNNFMAGLGSSSATANSGLSTGNWGQHSSNINIDSPTMSLSKVVMWGAAIYGCFWLFKKIRRK